MHQGIISLSGQSMLTFRILKGRLAVLERTLEAIFRRPIRLLLLIVLLPLVSVAVAYALPRSYESTARLWALRRYEIIGTTGPAVDPQAGTPVTPAQSQVTTLSELLQTRDFARAVVKRIALASTLNLDSTVLMNPQRLDDALFGEISAHVQVVALGYDLFKISYINHNPEVAQQVVEAVIQNYGLHSQELSVIEGQRLLAGDQAQLAQAKQDVAAAASAEAQYISAHPKLAGAALLADPQYALLHAETQQAQTGLVNIENNISTVNQEINAQANGVGSLFQVLDAPVMTSQPVSRWGLLLIAGGIGLGVAIFACVLYIFILVRLDRALHTPLDLRKVTTLPVVMQLPHLAPIFTKTTPFLIEEPVNTELVQFGGKFVTIPHDN